MRIDLSRPYGVIFGEPPVPGAKYEQDGQYFRASGLAVDEPEPAAPAPQRQARRDVDIMFGEPAAEPESRPRRPDRLKDYRARDPVVVADESVALEPPAHADGA